MKPEFPLILTSPRMKGPRVKEVQRVLAKNPYGDFYDGEIDGIYGDLTAQGAYRAKFWVGYKDENLNKIYGADLHKILTGQAKLIPQQQARRKQRQKESKSKTLADKALEEAKRWIGTKENPPGSNIAHPFVPWYTKEEFGRVFGFPWCAVFVSWCYHKAGSKAVNPKQARWRYCPWMVADTRAARNGLVLVTAKAVKPGNIVLFNWDGGVADHVGLFEKWKVPGQVFYSIEGNTAVGNDSNGGQVMRRERNVRNVECFARVTK